MSAIPPGYAVAAVAASGLIEPAAVCIVDGMVLDDRETSLAGHAAFRSEEAIHRLQTLFRYGWTAEEARVHAYVDQCVQETEADWLNAGACAVATGTE